MSEKLSIGNKNHGSCVNNDAGTASSMRPSAAWDICDKVWRAKKNVFAEGGIKWLLKTACYPVCLVLLSETVAPTAVPAEI